MPVTALRCAVDFADEGAVDGLADNGFHHGEVLAAVVGLEKGDPGVELDEDASQGEVVARV